MTVISTIAHHLEFVALTWLFKGVLRCCTSLTLEFTNFERLALIKQKRLKTVRGFGFVWGSWWFLYDCIEIFGHITPQHMECNLGVRYTTSYTVVVRIATSIVDVGVHSDKAKSSGLGSWNVGRVSQSNAIDLVPNVPDRRTKLCIQNLACLPEDPSMSKLW